MKRKIDIVTPKKGMRFYFPNNFENEIEFQRYVILKKEHNWKEYVKIFDPEENVELKIYIPHFAVIFGKEEIKLHIAGQEGEVMVATRPLLNKFQQGYMNGLKYFEDNYKVSPEILYGSNGYVFERTLHRHYYHPSEGNVLGEWTSYERKYPIVFGFDQLAEYGYYSALISCVKDLQKKHPIVFENFEKCELVTQHDLKTIKVHSDPTIEKIISHLKPLSGYWNGEKIMSNQHFDSLVDNVKYLIDNKKLPVIKNKIPNCNISNQFIMKTFSLLTKELYEKKRNPLFYELIKKSFNQFKDTSVEAIKKNYTTFTGVYKLELKLISYDKTDNNG